MVALITATAATHDTIFLALDGVGGRGLLLGLVGSVCGLRRCLSLGLSLRLGLLLLPHPALTVGFVLVDIGLRELDDGCGTTKHIGSALDDCLRQDEMLAIAQFICVQKRRIRRWLAGVSELWCKWAEACGKAQVGAEIYVVK